MVLIEQTRIQNITVGWKWSRCEEPTSLQQRSEKSDELEVNDSSSSMAATLCFFSHFEDIWNSSQYYLFWITDSREKRKKKYELVGHVSNTYLGSGKTLPSTLSWQKINLKDNFIMFSQHSLELNNWWEEQREKKSYVHGRKYHRGADLDLSNLWREFQRLQSNFMQLHREGTQYMLI